MKHDAPRTNEGAQHWRAAHEGRLEIPYCNACARYVWPPVRACGACGGTLEWRRCAGIGRIASVSVVRRAVDPALEGDVPYIVAFVDLDEGIRLFTNIVDADPASLACGQRVRCRFEPTTLADCAVPVFAPE